MIKKTTIGLAIVLLLSGCVQQKKATSEWQQKCSVELLSAINKGDPNQIIQVMVRVIPGPEVLSTLEEKGLAISVATSSIYAGEIVAKKIPKLAELQFVQRVETGSKPQLLHK